MNLKLLKDVPLRKLTTYRIGGPAKFFFIANDIHELIDSLTWAKEENCPLVLSWNGLQCAGQ